MWCVLLPDKGFRSQCSFCPILVSCLQGSVDNMSIAAACVPEWMWEAELRLTNSGHISWLRNKILLCQSTETWGLFVTVAQPNWSWLIHWVKSRFGGTKAFIPVGFLAAWVSESIKVPVPVQLPLVGRFSSYFFHIMMGTLSFSL